MAHWQADYEPTLQATACVKEYWFVVQNPAGAELFQHGSEKAWGKGGCGISLMPSKMEYGARHSSEVHSKRTRTTGGHKVNSCWIWWKLFWQAEQLGAGRYCPSAVWHPCLWKYSKLAWTTEWWTSSNFIAGTALSGTLDHVTSRGLSPNLNNPGMSSILHFLFVLL